MISAPSAVSRSCEKWVLSVDSLGSSDPYDGTPCYPLGRWRDLVTFAITKGGCTAGCIAVDSVRNRFRGLAARLPEWAVQRAGKLCGIAHEGALVCEACPNELLFDSLDTAVHHVARCNAVRTGESIAECYLGETLDGGFGVDRTVFVKKTTMTMGSVLAQTDVARNVERRKESFELFDGENDGSRGVVGGRASAVLVQR